MLPAVGTSTRPTLTDMTPPDNARDRAWQPTTDEMMASIAKVSAQRRADCPGFVAEFAEVYGADRTREELDQEWVKIVQTYPWYAEDVLHCLDATLVDRDRPVPALVCDIAQVEAAHGEVEDQITEAAWQALGRRWLQDLLERFRPVFEELSSS
jgi:hypothetical protein